MYKLPFENENTHFKRFATKVDCSRNAVWNLPALKKWIDVISKLGYNALMLYTEDTYEVEGHPYFGYGRGRFSKEELKEINAYALTRGVELIPSIATLAHLPTIFRWPQYMQILDTYDILLCEDERTYELIDAMLTTCEECFTSRVIDLNMGEEEMLGRGKYMSLHGYHERAQVLARHADKVRQLAKKHGFETVLLSDKNGCKADERWCVGDVWVRNAFNPENSYSIHTLRGQVEEAKRNGVENMVVRFSGDDGGECARFAGLPGLFCASRFAKGITDMDTIKRDFEDEFGIAFDAFLLLDLTQRNETQACGVHPSRYILYNDPLMGLMDLTIPDHTRADHEELMEVLKPHCGHPEWGYLFQTMYDLCAVTAAKCDIGLRIHAAYAAGDKAKLGELAEELRHIRDLVEVFYKSFRRQWMLENKGHGFDVSDVRIGGVMTRLVHCARRLEEYVAGQTDRIPELEDEQLDVRTPLSADYGKRKYMSHRDSNTRMYCDAVSTNVLFKPRR